MHSLTSTDPQSHRIVIVNSQFLVNIKAYGQGPGGALLFCGVTLELRQCQFIGNTAASGGAINIFVSVVLVVGCTFRENNARGNGGGGGAIFAINSHVEVYSSEFAEAGGALYFEFESPLSAAIATYYHGFIFQNASFTFNTVEKDH